MKKIETIQNTKKKTNEQHDKNEERRGPNPEKVEARRASARREGGPKGGARRNGARRVGGPDLEKVRAPRVGVRRVGARRVGHRSVGARRVGARRRGAQNFALFSLSPPPFSLFFSLSGGLLVQIWVFEAPGPLNVHVWSSRAVV